MQFISATLTSMEAGNIAWWAHIGGFIFGALFLKLFLQIPEYGISRTLSQATIRRDTPRLHIARPVSYEDDLDLHANLSITKEEAARGVKKLVSIPFGYQKKPLVLKIPPGIKDGAKLRLAGMGKKTDNGRRGDFYLNINIIED
jgi:hypothetical protein